MDQRSLYCRSHHPHFHQLIIPQFYYVWTVSMSTQPMPNLELPCLSAGHQSDPVGSRRWTFTYAFTIRGIYCSCRSTYRAPPSSQQLWSVVFFFCGRPSDRELPDSIRDPAMQQILFFKRSLKTFLFSAYLRTQRIRAFWTMRCTFTYLLDWGDGSRHSLLSAAEETAKVAIEFVTP